MNKKYYWLKLHNNFFQQSAIKKLRGLENGAIYTLIYLKLQLLSITTDGKIFSKGLEDSIAGDLSWEIDERAEDIEKVLGLLERYYLLEIVDEDSFLLTKVASVIGKEGESTERVRRMRSKNSELALQCNGDVTKSNTEIELEKELELELYPEKELEKELEKENDEVSTRVHAPVYLEDKNALAVETVSSVSVNTLVTNGLLAPTFSAKESQLPAENLPEDQSTSREMQIITDRLLSRINSNKANNLEQIPVAIVPEVLPPENTFEDFWKYFPKAYDRASTFEVWEQTLALGIDPADLVCAAKKYARKLKEQQTLPCYITSSRNFLQHKKFLNYLPTYLLTCPNCHGKGTFLRINTTGEQEYYICNCHERYKGFLAAT